VGHQRGRHTALFAVVVALGLAVAGCGSGGKHSGAPHPGGSAAPAAGSSGIAATARDRVKQGGTETVGIQQWIDQYNPYQVDGAQGDGSWLASLTLPDLFRTDASGVPHTDPDVLAGAKVTATSPRQEVTYTLNPKAVWSDGTPLSWKDFRRQWQDLNGSDPAYLITSSSGYDQISDVRRGADDHQVVVTFARPFGSWQQLFDPLLPAAAADTPAKFNKGWQAKVPITGGPWTFGATDKTTQTVTLVPWTGYWGVKPKLDKLVARALSGDADTDAFLNHEIDVTGAGTPDEYKSLSKAPGTDIRVGSRWDQTIMSFSNQGLLADQRLRQALQHAVDRKALAKVAGSGLPFTPPVLNSHFYMPNQAGYQDDSGGYGTYDLAAAKRLLDQAGWRDHGAGKPRTDARGRELKLSYVISSGSPTSSQRAQLVKSMLGQIGVDVEIQTVPANDFFEKYVNDGKYDLTVFREVDQVYASQSIPDYQKPVGTNVFENYGEIGTDQLDATMRQAAEQTDPVKARALYNQADRQLWALANYLPLFQTPSIHAVTSKLVNEGSWGMLDANQYVDTGYVG
jgi:peptide/nickel transport system substrate-binding protein